MTITFKASKSHSHDVTCRSTFYPTVNGTCMKTYMYVKCVPVSDLYHACPVPVKHPNPLHCPILIHETCMAQAHYALQDHAI